MRRLLPWLLAALVLLAIFLLGAQPHSAAFTEHFFGSFNHLARKAAHFIEYAVLFIALCFAARRMFKRLAPAYAAVACLILCVLAACADEYMQNFIPGRSASMDDVVLDAAGAACAFALYLLYVLWRRIARRSGV